MKTIVCLSALLLVSNAKQFSLTERVSSAFNKLIARKSLQSVSTAIAIAEEDHSWPKVKVPLNFELNANAYHLDETNSTLLPYKEMHMQMKVDTDSNRVYQHLIFGASGNLKEQESLEDFTTHHYIEKTNMGPLKICKERKIPAEINVKTVIQKFNQENNNITSYLGKQMPAWAQCEFHVFQAVDEHYYFCPKTLELKYLQQGNIFFKIENGLVEKTFTNADFNMTKCNALVQTFLDVAMKRHQTMLEQFMLFQ
ncbi:UNKNOWN [Stylonychia lemnae]|uniref:Uncharacterized protein n=1 Tax=Stylonychia lemnae TaxID=5949 RepID=A0A077ZPE7_STYLE|nr:UNKNOWN [Stylonychia lemnae]|eukprot:CDW71827.1 UNKNOWN [Stylonychia lemnae]